MFTLKLKDRIGNTLNEGDIVKVSDGKRFTFFCEVKYLEKEKAIAPFHTFSFHSFEKVDSVPANAKQSTQEDRYKFWYVYESEAALDNAAEHYETYRQDWNECERLLGSVFVIDRA